MVDERANFIRLGSSSVTGALDPPRCKSGSVLPFFGELDLGFSSSRAHKVALMRGNSLDFFRVLPARRLASLDEVKMFLGLVLKLSSLDVWLRFMLSPDKSSELFCRLSLELSFDLLSDVFSARLKR